ncbi:MAG: hypothetical protein K2N74_04645, partial [Clostridiales bacterium]|nr:hypothetical protein [Clostridiales bacterium]
MKNNLYYQDEYLKESFNFKMFWRLLKNAGRHKKLLFTSIFLELATSAVALLPSVLFSTIVQSVFPAEGVLAENWQLIVGLCLGGFALVWGSLVVGYYFEGLIPGKFGYAVCSEIRTEIFDHLTKLSFRYYDTHSSGKILVRVTNYVDELSTMFADLFYTALYAFGIVLIGIVWIIVLDWRLGGAVLLGLIPLGVVMYLLSKALHTRAGIDHNKNSNYTAFVAENIGGAEVVRCYNRRELNNAAASELFDSYSKAFMRTTRVREAFFPLAHGFVRAICTVIIYGAALAIILTGWGDAIELYQVVAIASVIGDMTHSLSSLCEQLCDI